MKLIEKRDTKTSYGVLSKGWYQSNDKLFLVKGNSKGLNNGIGLEPFSEVLGSSFGKFLGFDCISYQLEASINFPEIKTFDCDFVSVCQKYEVEGQILQFAKWADLTNGREVKDYFSFLRSSNLDKGKVFDMLILDAILGNSDRHLNNFDVIVRNGESKLAPIIDHGAACLALEQHPEQYKGIGPDKAKPFKETHSKQIALMKKYFPEYRLDYCPELVQAWVDENQQVFTCLGDERSKCIIDYVSKRYKFFCDMLACGPMAIF